MAVMISCLCKEQQASHVHLAGYGRYLFFSMVCTIESFCSRLGGLHHFDRLSLTLF